MTTEIRELLTKSLEKVEAAAAEPVEDTPADAVEDQPADEDPAPVVAEDPPATTPAEDAPEDPEATPAEPPEGEPKTPEAPTDIKAEEDPAPGGWSPAAREEWKSLSKTVRAEVKRREGDAMRALTMSSEARKLQKEFQEVVSPFMGFIAAEGSTPLQAVRNTMQTAAILRVGTPAQKAQTAAQIIKNFGIDLHMLDDLLAGQVPQDDPRSLIQMEVQQALAPVQQLIQQQHQFQAQQDRQLDAQVDQEISDFRNKHEFYDDVREIMADLIHVASQRGEILDLTRAYERATLMHEPVRRVIEQRKQRESARRSQAAAAKARQSASSVTGSPEAGVSTPPAGDSIRSAIEASIAKNTGR